MQKEGFCSAGGAGGGWRVAVAAAAIGPHSIETEAENARIFISRPHSWQLRNDSWDRKWVLAMCAQWPHNAIMCRAQFAGINQNLHVPAARVSSRLPIY